MADKGITFGVYSRNGRVPVKGRPVTDEFEMVSALYALLQQASKDDKLADGGLVGAHVSEPRLLQRMNEQTENLLVTVGDEVFRISVKRERG